MAREVVHTVIDDLDGSADAATVRFGLDGQEFEIDLGPANEAALRRALDPYLSVATRVRERAAVRERASRGPARPAGNRDDNAALRQWALDSGVELPGRGRIAHAVRDAYVRRDVPALYAAVGLEQD